MIVISQKLLGICDKCESLPTDLIGSEIISIGSPIHSEGIKFEGYGLAIDFITKEKENKRIIFEFNETGIWISHKS